MLHACSSQWTSCICDSLHELVHAVAGKQVFFSSLFLPSVVQYRLRTSYDDRTASHWDEMRIFMKDLNLIDILIDILNVRILNRRAMKYAKIT